MNEAIKSVPQPRTKVKITQKDILRFWSKANKTDSNEDCWNWKTGKDRDGYGRFWIDGDTLPASRVSWMISKGDIPGPIDRYPLFVCHKCDNPSCVNPNHLFLGTTRDNVSDMMLKGRQLSGENNGSSVLTAEKVIEIRRLNKELGFGKRRIAKMFNIGASTVQHILQGRTWAHLPDQHSHL